MSKTADRVLWRDYPPQTDTFGKQHWSTFAYLASCFYSKGGQVDFKRLRVNTSSMWRPTHSTTLSDGTFLEGHDDIEVWKDLVREGYLEDFHRVAVLTPIRGRDMAFQLAKHRCDGKSFATFDPTKDR